MTHETIPLPEPAVWAALGMLWPLEEMMTANLIDAAEGLFTAEQMFEYGAARASAERERCRDLVRFYMPVGWSAVYDAMAEGAGDGSNTVACPTCGSDCNERDELMKAEREIDRLTAERKLYHELIYAVGNKHPGETRHQTALRYIRQAERKQPDLEANMPAEKSWRTQIEQAVAAERERWRKTLAELAWASDAMFLEDDERRDGFARFDAAHDAAMALLEKEQP